MYIISEMKCVIDFQDTVGKEANGDYPSTPLKKSLPDRGKLSRSVVWRNTVNMRWRCWVLLGEDPKRDATKYGNNAREWAQGEK